MESFTPEGFVDIRQAAHILQIHYMTLWCLIRQQRVPGAIKVFGRKYLIKKAALEQFAAIYHPRSTRAGKPWTWVEDKLKEAFPEGIET